MTRTRVIGPCLSPYVRNVPKAATYVSPNV